MTNATQRALTAGWFYWAGYWFCTDMAAVLSGEAPACWSGSARDLCLAHGLAAPLEGVTL